MRLFPTTVRTLFICFFFSLTSLAVSAAGPAAPGTTSAHENGTFHASLTNFTSMGGGEEEEPPEEEEEVTTGGYQFASGGEEEEPPEEEEEVSTGGYQLG